MNLAVKRTSAMECRPSCSHFCKEKLSGYTVQFWDWPNSINSWEVCFDEVSDPDILLSIEHQSRVWVVLQLKSFARHRHCELSPSISSPKWSKDCSNKAISLWHTSRSIHAQSSGQWGERTLGPDGPIMVDNRAPVWSCWELASINTFPGENEFKTDACCMTQSRIHSVLRGWWRSERNARKITQDGSFFIHGTVTLPFRAFPANKKARNKKLTTDLNFFVLSENLGVWKGSLTTLKMPPQFKVCVLFVVAVFDVTWYEHCMIQNVAIMTTYSVILFYNKGSPFPVVWNTRRAN